MLRVGPDVTEPTGFDTGDGTVDAALADLRTSDAVTAKQAEAAVGALTWGQGLQSVSLRSVQEFLWYQLPSKFAVPLAEHRQVAQALGALFDRVGLPRYAELCRSPVTDTILAAYDTGGRDAGITVYRKALHNGGVEPPDIPDLISWGGMLGVEEHAAFWALADHLELAIAAGTYTPGGRGWRDTAAAVARDYLTVARVELDGNSYLERIQAERRGRWAESRGPRRADLTRVVAPLLVDPSPVPTDAEDHLAQIRWFLQAFAGDGAALTANNTLGRALLTEACHRFDWLILGKQAPPESQLPEAHRLRGILTQLGATRRRGRRLLLTTRGQQLLDADTPILWKAVTSTLIPTDPAEADAAEITLLLLLTNQPPGYGSPAVADILTGEGWRTEGGGPLTARGTGWLTGEVHGRLDFLHLTEKPTLTTRSGLTPTGRTAALTALRQHAHQPRHRP